MDLWHGVAPGHAGSCKGADQIAFARGFAFYRRVHDLPVHMMLYQSPAFARPVIMYIKIGRAKKMEQLMRHYHRAGFAYINFMVVVIETLYVRTLGFKNVEHEHLLARSNAPVIGAILCQRIPWQAMRL